MLRTRQIRNVCIFSLALEIFIFAKLSLLADPEKEFAVLSQDARQDSVKALSILQSDTDGLA